MKMEKFKMIIELNSLRNIYNIYTKESKKVQIVLDSIHGHL